MAALEKQEASLALPQWFHVGARVWLYSEKANAAIRKRSAKVERLFDYFFVVEIAAEKGTYREAFAYQELGQRVVPASS